VTQIGEDGVERRVVGALPEADGADDEQPRPDDRARHMGEHEERRPVRPMKVLDHQQQRSLSRGLGDDDGDRLEQPVARALRVAVPAGVGMSGREVGQEPRELGRNPPGRRGRGGETLTQCFGERPVGRHTVCEAAAGEGHGAFTLSLDGERRDEARLADAGLAGNGHHRRVAGAGLAPGLTQMCERIVAADKRRGVCAGQGRGQRRGPRRAGRARRVPLDLVDERPRLRGRLDSEVAHEGRSQRPIRRHGAGAVAGARESQDEVARGVLRQRVERHVLAAVPHCEAQIAGLLGRCSQRREHLAHALAMPVALLEHPVVVEVAQQLAAAELQCLRATAERDEAGELARVDPDAGRVLDPDSLAVGRNTARGDLAELVAQGGQRRAQARPRALLEDLGPELRSDPAARMKTRTEREPREQCPRPAARDALQDPPVEFDGQLSQQADPQHRCQPRGHRAGTTRAGAQMAPATAGTMFWLRRKKLSGS
jgi:hypothetical protein